MTIWMDLTNSMQVWQGGVVGIIRAELEIAKNLKKYCSNIRFVKYNGFCFVEINPEELNWLWNCTSVGDAYLSAMGRVQQVKQNNQKELNLSVKYSDLNEAYSFSESRLLRLLHGCDLIIADFPLFARVIIKPIYGLLSKLLIKTSIVAVRERRRRISKRYSEKQTQNFSYPFQEGDLVFSCGWLSSGKEKGFERVKQSIPGLQIVYLIYDIILIRENTKHFYQKEHSNSFEDYLRWATLHCDALLFGGETAMHDTQKYQMENHLRILPGYPVYFGCDISRKDNDDKDYRKSLGIESRFIMVVGSIDLRKNYSTLYRAMTILVDRNGNTSPQLIIVGKGSDCKDLVETIKTDPRTKNRIILITPTDDELDWLYKNTEFILLASVWEGWSLTLPEALGYGKLVIAADNEPLREVGKDFAIYVDTFDPYAWANAIDYYFKNHEEVVQIETRIKSNYKAISWENCGQQIAEILERKIEKSISSGHKLFMDMTLTYLNAVYNGKITGISRSELMFIKYMYFNNNSVQYYVLDGNVGYIPIDISNVIDIILDDDLDRGFQKSSKKLTDIFNEKHNKRESLIINSNRKKAFWYIVSVLKPKHQRQLIAIGKKYVSRHSQAFDGKENNWHAVNLELPFKKGDVVFSAGTGYDNKLFATFIEKKETIGFKYVSIIYDLTPIILPQVHLNETVQSYSRFLEFETKVNDLILYGGLTAQEDGCRYFKEMKYTVPDSIAIKFGSDISKKVNYTKEEDDKILAGLGINGPYTLTVGSMEIRKNHETLYRAYLRMLNNNESVPQMIFAGRVGWKTEDFIKLIERDERIKDKIIWLSPSDKELDVLYRNCLFTILPSLYEGWSLTLPESYWYGKFCLCCDNPALRETAGELADYVHCWDEVKWAERILYYYTHPAEIELREHEIKTKWHPISWEEAVNHVFLILKDKYSI